ncbi:hypothetical protein [Paenibacillus sp.]|nr:hypothetical protein [Paenibacillus sp.]
MALNRHVDSYVGPVMLFDFKRLKFGALHEKRLIIFAKLDGEK